MNQFSAIASSLGNFSLDVKEFIPAKSNQPPSILLDAETQKARIENLA